MNITIPEGDWEDTGDGRLLTTIVINGVNMHLEAIEVTYEPAGEPPHGFEAQVAENILMSSYYDRLADACEPDGHFTTTEINGKEYVLFAQPFSK